MSYKAHLALYDFFSQNADMKFYVILGNHDRLASNESYGSSCDLLEKFSLSNVEIFSKPTLKKIDGAYVNFLPFPYSDWKDALNVCHVDVKGSTMDSGRPSQSEIDPKDYVPNAAQMDRTINRLYSFFNTNEKIIQNKFTEDEWTAYYEGGIEADLIQLSQTFSRRIFTRREIGTGNEIIFEASNLQYASMSTKLNMVQMVDRGAMTPNEWRAVLGMAPIEGGDKPIRRLDTQVVKEGGE